MRWQWVFGAVCFFVIFLLFLHSINAGDFFHHLNSGKYVIEHFRLPYVDDLTFTAYGKPWVAYGWGSGVIYFIIYKVAGFPGISLLFAALGTLAAAFLFLTLRKLKTGFFPSLTLVFLAAAISSLRWPTRPEVMGAVFVSALIYFLTAGRKHFVFLPLFFWFWAVAYGASAFLGIIIFGFFLVVTKSWGRKSILIFGLSVVASTLNGYGLSSLLYIFQIPKIAPHVGEWLPLYKTLDSSIPDLVLFYQHIVLVYLLFVVLYVFSIVFLLIKKKEVIFANLFIFGLSTIIFAPFYTNRFINLAPFVAVPVLGIIYREAGGNVRKAILVGVLVIAFLGTWTRFTHFNFGLGLEPSPFQLEVTEFLRANKISGNIYASQEIGAFLSWQLSGSKVFVDTRDDLFTTTHVFEDIGTLNAGKLDIIALLNKYGANIVVGDIASGSLYQPLFYDDTWETVFLTDGYFVAVRKSLIGGDSGIKTYEALDPFREPTVKPGKLKEAEEELTALTYGSPDLDENKIRLIEIKLLQDKVDEAKAIFSTIKTSYGLKISDLYSKMEYLQLAGRLNMASGECDEAIVVFNKVDKLSKGQLIFFPGIRLPTRIDKYLGEYYLKCAHDKQKALEYFNEYFKANISPLEKRQIDLELEEEN